MSEPVVLKHGSLLISSEELFDMAVDLEGVIARLEINDGNVCANDRINLRMLLATLKGRFFGP